MSFRYMRIIVFFDLPTLTPMDRRSYSKFRKVLLQEGFIMMQESVYSKLLLNGTAANLMQAKLRKNKPKQGLVQMMTITEKQFANIEYLTGTGQKNIVDSTNRMIIL